MSAKPATPPLPDRSGLEAYLLLVGTMLCWAGNAVIGRAAVGEVSPMMIVLGRWVGVILLCLIFLMPRLRQDWPALRPHLPFLFLLGGIGFTGFNALFYVAAQDTTALNMGILQGSIPIFVLMGAFLVYGDRIRPIQLLGVLITLSGVVTVASHGSLQRLLDLAFNPGDILMVCACFLYASYAVGLRKRPPVSPLSAFAVMAIAALILAIPTAGVEAALGHHQWPTTKGWILIGLVTLFPSFIAQIFFIQAIDRIGPGRAGVFVNLVPVFAAAMAVLFLGERFQLYHALSLTLVLFGIFLSERFKTKAT